MRYGNAELFARNLSKLMEFRKTNGYRLAKQVGLTERALANYIHARRVPNVFVAWSIAEALDVSVEGLITDDIEGYITHLAEQ